MRRQDGFTLLEVMVAMGILAASLTILLQSQMLSIQASNRSKMITTAVLLARARLADLEDELFEEGFSDFGTEANGDFSDEGFPKFRWEWLVENVELPTVAEAQEAAAEGRDAENEGGFPDPASATVAAATSGSQTTDAAAEAMASRFGMIRGLLEASVRRTTFTIFWRERSREQSFKVQAYFTDPTRIP